MGDKQATGLVPVRAGSSQVRSVEEGLALRPEAS